MARTQTGAVLRCGEPGKTGFLHTSGPVRNQLE